jgi:hypothetical protein
MTWDEMEEIAEAAIRNARAIDVTTRDYARAALLALRDAGVRFMPAEATEEMLTQGAHKLREFTESRGLYPRTNSMYTAMLAAGEIKPEDGK